MPALPTRPISDIWQTLAWETGAIVEACSKNRPLAVQGAPGRAGIYRISWVGAEAWASAQHVYLSRGSSKIPDLRIDVNPRVPPLVLSIGRTTDLRKRLRQHFGDNENNNRILGRMRGLLPGRSDAEIRDIAAHSLKVEWVVVECWIQRCLLEAFGKAVEAPVLDIDAEH